MGEAGSQDNLPKKKLGQKLPIRHQVLVAIPCSCVLPPSRSPSSQGERLSQTNSSCSRLQWLAQEDMAAGMAASVLFIQGITYVFFVFNNLNAGS